MIRPLDAEASATTGGETSTERSLGPCTSSPSVQLIAQGPGGYLREVMGSSSPWPVWPIG